MQIQCQAFNAGFKRLSADISPYFYNRGMPVAASSVPTPSPAPCWVCGAPADSREHRLKKSDLVARHGRGKYTGDKKMVHVVGGVEQGNLQGPGAAQLMYEGSLCSSCNNHISQPADRAYETFMAWVLKHEVSVLQTRTINLRSVYGDQPALHIENLIRYFCKSLGCKIQSVPKPVPGELAVAVRGGALPAQMAISFCVQEELADFPDICNAIVGKSDLLGNGNPYGPAFYSGKEMTGWLTTMLDFNHPPEPDLGTILRPDVEMLTLGSVTSMPDDERATFIENMKAVRATRAAMKKPPKWGL